MSYFIYCVNQFIFSKKITLMQEYWVASLQLSGGFTGGQTTTRVYSNGLVTKTGRSAPGDKENIEIIEKKLDADLLKTIERTFKSTNEQEKIPFHNTVIEMAFQIGINGPRKLWRFKLPQVPKELQGVYEIMTFL
jgi:hypothetical protein